MFALEIDDGSFDGGFAHRKPPHQMHLWAHIDKSSVYHLTFSPIRYIKRVSKDILYE